MWSSPPKWLVVGFALFLSQCLSTPLWAQSALENPQPGSAQSGIGLISGWHCNATQIDFLIDDRVVVPASYGTIRGDTQEACGDNNNGFGLLVNWNILGDGQHTIVARADGLEFARSTFTITTLGTAFLQGASGDYRLPGFPAPGTDVTVKWQESTQSFAIAGVTNGTQDAYQVHGIEQELACPDPRQNGTVTFNGTLAGSPTNGTVHLVYNNEVEVSATLLGIQSLSGVVIGNFSAQASINGSVVRQSQGNFHGIITDRNVYLTYLVLLSDNGCRTLGTLSGGR